ncbi:metal ABC transporter permease [bacterium]|nr:metal ABC transporter permease [bacterium]
MIEALQFEFMRNAVIAGLLISVACGIIGALVVVNRMVFISGGIAHAAYGGIGLAFFFRLPPLLGASLFSVVIAMIIGALTFKNRHRSDTIIGVLWAAGMALGIILIDLTPGYAVDLMSYLFGSILTIPAVDLWLLLALDAVILLAVIFYYRDFLALSYDEQFASLRGVPVKILYFALLVLASLTIVMTIRLVGLILVIALLTIPTYMAEKMAKSLGSMMVYSAILSAVFTLSGLWVSYTLNITSGAAIIMVATVAFFISYGIESLKN